MVRRQIFILPYEIPKHSTQEIHKSHRALDPNLAAISTTYKHRSQMPQPISHILWKIQFFINFLTIMLLRAKWDVYHNIDLQFGGKRSQISNSGDALGVYHHK